MEWTKEYYGLSHLGEFSTKKLWVTVTRYSNGRATLSKWFPGCQFSPEETTFKNVEEAKRQGEIAMGIGVGT